MSGFPDKARQPGLLILLSAPSGAGKGTVREALDRLEPDLVYGVSVTTRRPRPGEVEGVHYYFRGEKEFEQLVASGQLVEWSRVYGNYYGTPRRPMEDLLAQGRDVIVEKDVQGARKLMALYPDAVSIFVLPPSLAELRRRIENRGTESTAIQQQRLQSVDGELAAVENYQYCIVNDEIEVAAAQVAAIIQAERCRVQRFVAADNLFWMEE